MLTFEEQEVVEILGRAWDAHVSAVHEGDQVVPFASGIQEKRKIANVVLGNGRVFTVSDPNRDVAISIRLAQSKEK